MKDRMWFGKIKASPLSLRIVIVWMYLLGTLIFLGMIFKAVTNPTVDALANLIVGPLLWVIADGLLNRNNFFRMSALFLSGFTAIFFLLLLVQGQTGNIYALDLSNLGLAQIGSFWAPAIFVLMNILVVMVLLLPGVKRLYVTKLTVQEIAEQRKNDRAA